MEGWTIAYVDSEEREREDGTAENAIDGQTANFWHTEWGAAQPGFPHRLILDLGQTRTIGGLPRHLPAGSGGRHGPHQKLPHLHSRRSDQELSHVFN